MGKPYSYIMYIDIGPITRYIVTLNWAFFAVLLAISSVMCLLGFRFGRDIEKEAERQQLTLSETDIRELLYDSIRAVEPTAAASGITSVPDFPEEPVIASCDDTRLRRAVTNILSNGVRYARSELCLTCRADKRHVTIRIQDDGDGIAEEDIPHIFDRFYMGRSGKSGIGLALTKEIIHLHKGTIRAYNGDNGAVFEISIPGSR